MKQTIGIYLHIPFCKSKCYYCDFVSYANREELIESYINALCLEILQNAEILSEYNITSIYIGGGTPSYIPEKYIAQILHTLSLFIPKEALPSIEITMEVNPNSVSDEKMAFYQQNGINRISIGLQTTHNDILHQIGRVHQFADFENALKSCKKADIQNISVDLIYPLPSLTKEMLKSSLNELMMLKENYPIKHISIYNLEVHENTKLAFLLKENYLSLCDEEEEYAMKELIDTTLEENGFEHYEISNYALPNFESKHNMRYWNQDIYLGFGVNASSFIAGTRYKNVANIEEYIQAMHDHQTIIEEKEELDQLGLMKEYVILQLRLKKGVNVAKFHQKFNTNIEDIFGTEIEELIQKQLIERNHETIYLTKRGREVANLVWEKFI